MRPRLTLARGLLLVVALVTASSVAFAAPAKRHKPKSAPKSAPADDTTAKPDDTALPRTDAEAPAKDDAAPPQVDESAPPQAVAAPAAAPEVAPVQAEAKLPDLHDPPPSSADEALGKREAERIAAGRSEVAVLVGVDVGTRHFKYSDPVGTLYAAYRLPVAPMASFGLEAYPLASTDLPVLRDLGFQGRLSRAFAVNSKTPDGTTIETSWTRFGGEVRERILLPSSHPVELGVYVGGDASYFTMKTKTPVAALLPSAKTVAVRFGFDARVLAVGRVSFLLGGAYLATTSPGEIYDRFRAPHVHGVDAELGAAVALVPGLELRLSGRYTRYFSTFKPLVGDALVAGGALDEQMQFGLGVRYAH